MNYKNQLFVSELLQNLNSKVNEIDSKYNILRAMIVQGQGSSSMHTAQDLSKKHDLDLPLQTIDDFLNFEAKLSSEPLLKNDVVSFML